MYSKQETFDMVVAGLRAQGRPCMGSIGRVCAYRGEHISEDMRGMRCAAGILLPDSLYSEDTWEGVGGLTDNPKHRDVFAELGHDAGLVMDLQVAHDAGGSDGINWPRFCEVAEKHCLNPRLIPEE